MTALATRRLYTRLLTGGPKTLAALRIATGLAVLLYVFQRWSFTLPPDTLQFPPTYNGGLSLLPASQQVFQVGLVVLAISAVGVVVGWRPAVSASVAAAAFFYVGGMTTFTGKIDHNHHLFWVLLLLAVSPAANEWSVRRESRSGSFQWPVTAVMLILGLIYFSAGLQKLLEAGLGWGWSDNLVNTMLAHSWEKGIPVHSWLVDWPVAGRVLGVGALLFELAFLPCMFFPKVRKWVWPAGLLFHWGTWWLLGISFLSLQAMYVVFLPWDRQTDETPPTGFQQKVIIGLLAVVMLVAVSGIEYAWPFAAYPGFEQMKTTETTTYLGDDAFLPELESRVGLPATHIVAVLDRAISSGQCETAAQWLGVDTLQEVTIDLETGVAVATRDLC